MPANLIRLFVVMVTIDRPPLSIANQWMYYWDGITLVEHRSPLL